MAARSACFKKHSVGDFAWSAKALGIGEAVVASESTDGLALVFNEEHCRMLFYCIPEPFELSVDCLLTQPRLKGRRIEEDVDIF
jgi:hypothetical protein